ncbi:integrase, catalytic region, zinc finger, CCHC-type containing protein [Tanacetum coccineum]
MKDIFEELEAEVDQNVVNMKHDEIERKNLLIANDNLIVDCLSKEVFYVAMNSELNVSRFTEMHAAHTIVKARCLELKAKLSNLRDKVQKDDHTEFVKRFSNLEVNHLNLQLKYQNLKESFGNKPSPPARDTPNFDSVFIIGKMKASIQGKDNAIKKAENAKVKQHYKELYDSIKITRAKHIEQTTALTTENKNLKAQIHENLKCNTIDSVKPRVLTPGRYAMDVEPIPPNIRNNREVHLDYLKHLKESVETLREIVEEAKVERPLNRSLASAYLYTKHSQELLEYVIGTCPKDFNPQDKKHVATPLTRKKQVIFANQCETSNNNAHKHVKHMNLQQTNVPVPPSTGVNSCTDASRSQPMSTTKKNRILPVKSVNKKKVEEHPRTNKSSLQTTNRVDSSISSKRTVVQIILWYLDSGCSKHMTGDRSRLRNFMKKFIGTVRFGNDHFGAIMGYGDYVIRDSVISRVYYVEGLGYNMFFVGQFCDSNLEVAFRKHSCYVRDTDGVELIKGSRGSNLYTISVEDMMKSSPICLLSKASKKYHGVGHSLLNHLNFGTINDLARKDLVRGLPRLKFEKEHLYSACQLGKSKKHTHKPKSENTNLEVLNTLHMDFVAPEPSSEASSFGDVSPAESTHLTQTHHHLEKWSKDHPLYKVIGNPSRPVSTRKQLATDAWWSLYNFVPSKVKPKNFKTVITEDCWFQAMQDESHEFDRLQVWELVPRPDCVMIIALKWIYKVKLDEYGDVLKNKAQDKMADENVPAPAPTRSDDQILPFAAWVPIGKSNYVLDLQKKQKNPIFQISVDILQNTNFFRAFTASASVPAIYIQQFWNTLVYEAKTGAYSF